MTSKKYRFIFFITRLFPLFVNKDFFFQEYIEMGLKIFFITSEEFLAIATFKHEDK